MGIQMRSPFNPKNPPLTFQPLIIMYLKFLKAASYGEYKTDDFETFIVF
jgi:hypothetical protein